MHAPFSCTRSVLLLVALLITCVFADYGTLLTSNIRTGALDGTNTDSSYTSTCAPDVDCGTQSVLSVPGSSKIYATSGLRLYRSRDELSSNPTPLFDPIDSDFPINSVSSLYSAPGGMMIVLLSSQLRLYRDVATTPVLVASVGAPDGVTWVSGALDGSDQFFWILGSSGAKTNAEINWLRFNSTSAVLMRPSNTINLATNNYCGSIAFRSISLIQSENQMIFGCTGTVLTVPANAPRGANWNPSNSVTTYSVGAGVYTSATYYAALDTVFFGADIGLGVACDAANSFNIRALFFISAGVQSSGLTSIFLDQSVSPPVVFWGATTGNIIRTFYIGARGGSFLLETANDVTLKANHSISAITVNPAHTDRLIVSIAAFKSSDAPASTPVLSGATSELASLMKSACSSLPCKICIDDPYCGFCYSTGACDSNEGCNSQWDPDLPACLNQIQISPTSGAIDGRTLVTVTGNAFSSEEIANYRCAWVKADTTSYSEAPVSVTSTSLVCRSPNQGSVGTATLDVYWGQNARLNNGTAVSFSVYDCSGSLCGYCVIDTKPECGWCFHSKSCKPSAACPTTDSSNPSLSFNQGVCPQVAQISPSAASFAHPLPLTVTVSRFLVEPSNDYYCEFKKGAITYQTQASSATSGPGLTALTCPSPTADISATGGQFLLDIVDAQNRSWTGYTFIRSVELYNCPELAQCSDCRHPSRPDCVWCDSNTCQYASATTCAPGAACPSITSIDPPSLHTSQVSDHIINIYGTNFADPQSQQLDCAFIASNIYYQSATFISPTQVTCRTPVSPLPTNQMSVTLRIGPRRLMDPHPFLVYDCNPTDCETCLEPLRTSCLWCPAPASFGCSTGDSTCTGRLLSPGANASCPDIYDLQPPKVAFGNPIDVQFNGNFSLLQNSDLAFLSCGFGADTTPGTRSASTATVLDPSKNFIKCPSVPSTSVGVGSHVAYLFNAADTVYDETFNFEVAQCGDILNCSTCLGTEGCFYCAGECTTNCTTNPEHNQLTCPSVSEVTPNHIDRFGDTSVYIMGSGFLPMDARGAKRDEMDARSAMADLTYVCHWLPTSIQYLATNVTSDFIQCPTPQLASNMTVNLQVLLNGLVYASAPAISVFQCGTYTNDLCAESCSSTTYCGWCVGAMSCGGEERCGDGLWLSGCITTSLSSTFASLDASLDLTITLHGTNLPTRFRATDFGCQFATVIVPSSSVAVDAQGAITSVTCPVPASSQDYPNDVEVALVYRGNKVAAATTFSYVDCVAVKDCDRCIATPNCGWCTEGTKRCSVQYQCGVAKHWSNKRCPINKVALGVGLGVGLFALVILLILIAFLIRRARRKSGLVIQLREPDYDAIAWGTDVELLYRIPDDKYHALNLRLARKDYLLQLALALKCPATEQDALAKALVYVACAHDVAAEMIQTVIRAEVSACLEENTLFRSNSVASKMYKFYSRIVGIKYLYHCIARVVLELEVLGKQQEAGMVNPKKSKDTENEVSLLAVSMELDTEKDIEDDVDTDTNLLQLQLICQKILTVLIKTSLKNIPSPLRRIFVEIDNSVTNKFPGSLEAVYKGLGGLFFLRFVCPAITAPHVYGLLPNPPNTTTQRQLVLITKVIQSIANMQAPGKKEQYMEVMGSFIENSIPRIRKFYDNLRMAANINSHTDIYEREIVVPDEVLMNGLAVTQTILVNEASKIKAWAPESWLDVMAQADLNMIIDECLEANNGPPKKARKQNPNEPTKKKKGKQ